MFRIAPPRPRRTGKPARFSVEILERRCLLSGGPDPLANFQINDVLTIPGKAFTLPLASCNSSYTRQLTATIDWGDGTPVSPAAVRADSEFSGTHEFAAPGNYAAKLRIDELFPDGGHFFEDKTIPVRVAAPSIHVVPGSAAIASNIPGYLAGSPAYFTTDLPDYATSLTASVDWGDGSVDASVPYTHDFPGVTEYHAYYSRLYVQHAYAAPGRHQAKVTVSGDGISASCEVEIVVSPSAIAIGPWAPASPLPTQVVIDTPATLLVLGQEFGLSSPRGGYPDSYSASYDWGDGTTSASDLITPLTFGPDAGFPVLVEGTHSYRKPGNYAATVTLSDIAGNSNQITLPVHVIASAETVTPFSPTTLQGLPSVVDLATVTESPSVAAPFGGQVFSSDTQYEDLNVAIDWGDGTPTAAPLGIGRRPTYQEYSAGDTLSYDLNLPHTYVKAGHYLVRGTIAVVGTDKVTTFETPIEVVPFLATTVSIAGRAGDVVGTGGIAVAAVPNGSLVPADYAASIDWGDGTASDEGIVTLSTDPGDIKFSAPIAHLTISGSHTYRSPGDYVFKVTLATAQGDQRTISGAATLVPSPMPVVAPIAPQAPTVASPPPPAPMRHRVLVYPYGHPDEVKWEWLPVKVARVHHAHPKPHWIRGSGRPHSV